ncbi:MAG: hypothetical protein ACQESV_02270 [Thermodesulfobacteriota bacterium]
MLDKATFITVFVQKLEKLPVGHCLDARTYKRNRSVVFRKESATRYQVRQLGFYQDCRELEHTEVRKFLKKILKQEFPRSTKIRVYDLGPCDLETAQSMGRKQV